MCNSCGCEDGLVSAVVAAIQPSVLWPAVDSIPLRPQGQRMHVGNGVSPFEFVGRTVQACKVPHCHFMRCSHWAARRHFFTGSDETVRLRLAHAQRPGSCPVLVVLEGAPAQAVAEGARANRPPDASIDTGKRRCHVRHRVRRAADDLARADSSLFDCRQARTHSEQINPSLAGFVAFLVGREGMAKGLSYVPAIYAAYWQRRKPTTAIPPDRYAAGVESRHFAIWRD